MHCKTVPIIDLYTGVVGLRGCEIVLGVTSLEQYVVFQ